MNKITDVINFVAELERKVKLSKKGVPIYLEFPDKKISFTPFSQIYLGLSIRRLTKDFDCLITYINFDCDWLWFPKSNGFFALANGKTTSDDFNGADGENFIPIRYLEVPDLSIDDSDVHESEVKRMQAIGDDLANRLIKDGGKDTKDTLSYLCREILRNIVEHSFSDSMFYSAQFNPTTKKVEVIIADEGEGLMSGLSINPNLKIEDDRHAIKLAILPGISGRAHKYTNRSRYDTYKNSGYGLYMAEKICSEAGSFLIISGKSGRHATPTSARYLTNLNFRGTILKLTIDIGNVDGIESRLERYRAEAHSVIKQIKSVSTVTPSAASLMLRI